ncbi:MAG: WcbI family polysaccharide biosynthesis putative acetyltransferase [Mycobacteriaceae bacterium]
MEVDGRTAHYGVFYGVHELINDDRPLWLVHGNCQAESLRILLTGPDPATAQVRTVRIPPVHELTAEDVPHLQRLLAHTQVLLSQPVKDGYRDLPLGTDETAALLPSGARVLRWPVLRYAGLYPYQVIVRHPDDGGLDPPVVAYHDLRTVAVARGRDDAFTHRASPQAYRQVAADSTAELARREAAQCDVGVSDLLATPAADLAHTINHPGNRVLAAVATRLQEAGGLAVGVSDPGRDLLGGVRSPLEPEVVDALGLATAPRSHWNVGGEEVDPAVVHEAQLAAYAEDPKWVEAAVARYEERLELLGLA